MGEWGGVRSVCVVSLDFFVGMAGPDICVLFSADTWGS